MNIGRWVYLGETGEEEGQNGVGIEERRKGQSCNRKRRGSNGGGGRVGIVR